MSKLDDLIPLSETVLWRWPRTMEPGMKWLFRIAAVIAAAMAGAFWYADILGWELLWVFAVPYLTNLPRMWGDRVREIVITSQWIVISRGLLRRRVERIEKREFERATLWEHRGHLNLHRTGRETLKVQDIGESDGLVEALGLPTRVWPKREATRPVRRILHLTGGLIFLLLFAGMTSMPVLLAIHGAPAWLPDGIAMVGLIIGAILGMIGFACIVGGAAGVFLARLARGDALAQFIHGAADPAWLGEKAKPGITFRYLNAVARLVGAEPVTPDTVEPLVVNGPLPGGARGPA